MAQGCPVADTGPVTLGTRCRLTGLLTLAAVLAAPLITPAGATAVAGTPSTIVVAWGTQSSVTRGTSVRVTGTIAPNVEQRTVELQRDVPGSAWAAVSRQVVPAASGGGFSFTLPTSYYGSFRFRVFAAASATEDPATSDTHALEVNPPYTPRGKAASHSFLVRPLARWNPCARIDYRVNDARARAGALRDVKQAVLRIRHATGLNLVYAGRTSKVPTGKVGDRYPSGTELVIAWARPAATNMLGAGSTAAGRGGPVYSSGYVDGAGDLTYLIKQGGVVLNANLNSRIRNGFGTGQTRGELLMHEIGHALGLGHTSARGQIMYRTLQPGIARFEAGDLAGLNRLGAQQGCLVRASSRSAARAEPPREWISVSP